MKNFPEFETESMGGCEGFEFIPIDTIKNLAVTRTSNELETAIELLDGNTIFEGLAILDSLEFTEPQENQKAGGLYKTKVVGVVPKMTSEYLTLFNEMTKHRHIVLVTDSNGFIRVVGYENGARFKFDQSSGKKASDMNGFSFEFTAESRKPSPFYAV